MMTCAMREERNLRKRKGKRRHESEKLESTFNKVAKGKSSAANTNVAQWHKNLKMTCVRLNAVIRALILTAAGLILFAYHDRNSAPTWNTSDPVSTQVQHFLSTYLHQSDVAYCHPSLVPELKRRTHSVKRLVPAGDTVLVLPRELLVWDLDAVRYFSNTNRRETLRSRHADTGNALDSGAYLAFYLVHRSKVARKTWIFWDKRITPINAHDNARILPFLDVLPKYNELQSYHPLFWSAEERNDLLGNETVSHALVTAYRDMIESEYQALRTTSFEFRENVNERDYIEMRVNVMSRSFGTGPPGKEEQLAGTLQNLEEELTYYNEVAGVDFTKGCKAMSPILDMWDHHARPNVDWKYNSKKRAFVVTASGGGVPAGQDVMVSYGKYTDTHLFAKFGFVNGDGSGYTEASISVLHRLLDTGTRQQFSYLSNLPGSSNGMRWREAQNQDLVQYLTYDDGYKECIRRETDADAYRLKVLKWQHLKEIANIRDRWVVRMPPRNASSLPAMSSNMPIAWMPPAFDPKSVVFDGSKIISTCRLIALTNEDYDSNAVQILSDILTNNSASSFLVKRQSDQLEFRALTMLARLTSFALMKYPSTVAYDMNMLHLPNDNMPFRSKEWTAAQVRLGEMQTLEVLNSIASSGARQMRNNVQHSKMPMEQIMPAMFIRLAQCPIELSLSSLDD